MSITLEELLEEIKYGKDFVDAKKTINEIENYINEDYNILLVGERSLSLLENLEPTKAYSKKLLKATRNYKEFENRLLENKSVSSVYSKMKIDSIIKDVNDAIDLIQSSPKELRESNKEDVAKVISTLKYGISILEENTTMNINEVKEANRVLQIFIDKEDKILNEALKG